MIKRATIWFITAFTFVFLSQAQAKLPFNAFKNVSHHFLNVYYSPVLGMSALESGIITTIRFAFVDHEVINQGNGMRIFLADQISNPHGTIAKILFPSVTGELGIDTNAQVTLSSHATPEFMATIMVITSKIRQLVQTQSQDEVDRFLNGFWETYFFKATKQSTSGILTKQKTGTNVRNKLKKQITELFNYIAQAIIEEEKQLTILPKYSVEQLVSAFVCTKLNTRDELEEYLISLYLQDTEHLIFRDLSSTSSSSIKPFEDIALFDFKDEASYLEVLTTTLHAPSELSSSSSSAASSSGPSVSTYGDTSRILDALYALTVMPYFSKPIPYINEAPSHGPARFVEGSEATVKHERGTFSDCNENSLRVLLNLMIFDAAKRDFNLAFLQKASGPRLQLLKDFYSQYQPVIKIGASSESVRTQWNRVVGDLNSLPQVASSSISSSSSSSSSASPSSSPSSSQSITTTIAPVRYLQGNNELDSGFANVLRVFEKVFGISLLPSFPEMGSIEEQKEAVQHGFMALFKFIAPGSQVELEFINLHSKPGDLAGKMTVTVNNKFQFTLYESEGTHGHVEEIKSLIAQSSTDQERLRFLTHFDTVLQNETIATFALLQKSKQQIINNPFYNLFSTPIHGNGEALSFLEKLATMPADSRFNLPLKFVLKQVAWDDYFAKQYLFRKLESMLGGAYDHAIFEGIGYFEVSKKYPIEYVEANMKNLMYIEFRDESYVNIQNDMLTIKEIFLPEGAKLPLDLRKLPNLESLHLRDTDITSLEFRQPMPNLKKIIFPYSLDILTGIENLQALEKMELYFTKFRSFKFTHPMFNLKSITFPTSLATLTGIENLQALEYLNLKDTKITSLEFTQPMPNLKSINFPNKLAKLSGIDNLQGLKRIDLSYTKITSLAFTQQMPNLKEISLPDTIKSCTLIDKIENWEVKQLNDFGMCVAEPGKRTICVHDPRTVRFTFLGDGDGSASSSLASN